MGHFVGITSSRTYIPLLPCLARAGKELSRVQTMEGIGESADDGFLGMWISGPSSYRRLNCLQGCVEDAERSDAWNENNAPRQGEPDL